ncbi:phage portal protein family protein [Maridesulfovibrio bastinii]|uniref:phage portal protein family protein n=1 Tax=Maridesulfovibrio bastinii TaxID=47157 RepID=UPI00040C0C09|nr:DUF935 family protein [Maridesulfovibrio bastinii]
MSGQGIFAPNGDFISFESSKLSGLGSEFATASRAWGYDPASWFSLFPDPDPVLKKRGDDAEILKEIVGDDEISTGIEKRILRTQNKTSFNYSPGHAEGEEPDERSIAICKMFERDLGRLHLRNLFGEILETPFFGPTFSELMWEPHNGSYRLSAIVSKPRDWFGYDYNQRPVFLSVESPNGEPLPVEKFLITRHRPSYENPYGVRLLTRCLWPVAFKRGGIEFWSRFCEKFGQPWIIAKAGENANARSQIAAQLSTMVQDAVAVLPKGSEVELAEVSGKSGDLHKSYVTFWNKAISKVLTGQTLSTDQDGQGSRAASQTHSEQLDALAESDQAMLINSMNELAIIYTRINMGTGVFPPVFGFTEPEDYNEKADLDKKLYSVGVRFKAEHFVNKYGLSADEFDVVTDSSPSSSQLAPYKEQEPAAFAAPGAGSNFSTSDDYQQAIDRFAAEMSAQAVKINKGFVTQLEKTVQQAESVEDLHARLAELLGQELDQDEMEELLTNAMINVRLAGHAATHRENDD